MSLALGDISVLYVEDDELNRKVMSLIFEKLFKLQKFAIFDDSNHFEERISRLEFAPDLVLLDIHVRPIDGFAMLKILRAHPDYAHAKVLAMTAAISSDDVVKLREAGFDGLIGKPVSLKVLPQLVERAMNGEAVWDGF